MSDAPETPEASVPERLTLGEAMVVEADRALRALEQLQSQARLVDDYLGTIETRLQGLPEAAAATAPRVRIVNDHLQTIKLHVGSDSATGGLVITVGHRAMQNATHDIAVGRDLELG